MELHRGAVPVLLRSYVLTQIYMGIFAYLYHEKYVKNERRNDIAEWIDARRTVVHRDV